MLGTSWTWSHNDLLVFVGFTKPFFWSLDRKIRWTSTFHLTASSHARTSQFPPSRFGGLLFVCRVPHPILLFSLTLPTSAVTKTLVICCLWGIILPSYIAIKINYEPASIIECHPGFERCSPQWCAWSEEAVNLIEEGVITMTISRTTINQDQGFACCLDIYRSIFYGTQRTGAIRPYLLVSVIVINHRKTNAMYHDLKHRHAPTHTNIKIYKTCSAFYYQLKSTAACIFCNWIM